MMLVLLKKTSLQTQHGQKLTKQ
ncbi:hypothetical protein PT2222_180015 [Paraburkholderia tropica]